MLQDIASASLLRIVYTEFAAGYRVSQYFWTPGTQVAAGYGVSQYV